MEEITSKEFQSLQAVKKKIQESDIELLQKALENGELPDEHILRFLRSRNYDIQTSFERIKKTHHSRTKTYPEVFINLTPSIPENRDGLKQGKIRLLKHRDLKGRFVLTMRTKDFNPDFHTGDYVVGLLTIVGWECLRFKEAQINGFTLIFDGQGFNLKHAMLYGPLMLLKWANVTLGSSPCKMKGLHFVNAPLVSKSLISGLKMALPKKLSGRIHVHTKIEKGFLDEIIPSVHLPEWLGGDLTDDEATDWDFIQELISPEREDYYKGFIQPSFNALGKC